MDIPLDVLYYINLEHRTDKQQHIETNVLPYFEETPLEPRIERFSAIRHKNGAVGCSLSHLEVARKAKSAGARYYLVFEDDFEFLISKEEFQDWLSSLFSPPQLDFKVVMLAYNALQNEPFSDIVHKSHNAQTTAGFIVNCAYVDELIACWEYGLNKFLETGVHWNWACDQCWKVLQKEKWFIAAKRVGKQKPFISDIGQHWVNPEF
jgi:GR25 family glycosyltransferase involved in LPS biosynthesis